MKWPAAKNWQYGLGIVWAIVGAFSAIALGIISAVVPTPQLYELKIRDTVVVQDPEVVQTSRAVPWFLRLRTEAGEMKIENVCSIWTCALDSGPSISGFSVRRGDRISAWTREEQIWQLTGPQGTVLTLDRATRAHVAYERRGYTFAIGMCLIGALLAYWGVRRERSNSTMERDARKSAARPSL